MRASVFATGYSFPKSVFCTVEVRGLGGLPDLEVNACGCLDLFEEIVHHVCELYQCTLIHV